MSLKCAEVVCRPKGVCAFEHRRVSDGRRLPLNPASRECRGGKAQMKAGGFFDENGRGGGMCRESMGNAGGKHG